MARTTDTNEARRRVLMLIGGSAVAGLSACSGGSDAPAPAASAPPAPEPAPEPSAEAAPQAEPAPAADAEPAQAGAAGGELPRLSEDDPTATSLGYVADATSVDQSQYPRYAAGQKCANCALFQGGDADWGACSIFPGKSVKATGWCSVYAPKAG